jgi:hypothetical protein
VTEIDPDDVDFTTWITAIRAVDLSCELLEIDAVDRPGIEWFASSTDAGFIRGRSERTLWLNADLDPVEIVRTVAHEIKHLKQIRRGRVPRWGPLIDADLLAWAEDDATRFETRALRHYRREYGQPPRSPTRTPQKRT